MRELRPESREEGRGYSGLDCSWKRTKIPLLLSLSLAEWKPNESHSFLPPSLNNRAVGRAVNFFHPPSIFFFFFFSSLPFVSLYSAPVALSLPVSASILIVALYCSFISSLPLPSLNRESLCRKMDFQREFNNPLSIVNSLVNACRSRRERFPDSCNIRATHYVITSVGCATLSSPVITANKA